jgi:hypothetical protein
MTFPLFSLLIIFLVIFPLKSDEIQSAIDWSKPGNCKGMWRPEKLPGRCSGMNPNLAKLPGLPEIHNASACRAVCCNLGERCISWQFEVVSKECRFGPEMRLGNEISGVPGWCDPNPPVSWNGKRVKSRDMMILGKVEWKDDVLDSQCFGLGAEKIGSNQQRLNTEQCQQACANDRTCEIWQEHPLRGCYYFSNEGVFCIQKKNPVYIGGRKDPKTLNKQ